MEPCFFSKIEPHNKLVPVAPFARTAKACFFVHMARCPIPLGIIQGHVIIPAAFACKRHELSHSLGAVTLISVFIGEHNSPQNQLTFLSIFFRHRKTDGHIFIIYSEREHLAVFPLQPCLCRRNAVGRNKAFVIGTLHGRNGVEIFLGGGAKSDHSTIPLKRSSSRT